MHMHKAYQYSAFPEWGMKILTIQSHA